jgi:hypothetical protein
MDRIFFFHNPKAGGTAVKRWIEAKIRAQFRCPLIENDVIQHVALRGHYSQFRGYQLYAGHYGYDIFQAVNAGHRCFTNFRHPVARLISLYNYFRFAVTLPDEELRTDRFFAVRYAKTADFRKFISTDDPRVEVYVRNAHYRQLSNSCWSLEMKGDLSEAFQFIHSMPCYYVCEFPELSVRWMQQVFDKSRTPLSRENVTDDRSGRAISLFDVDHGLVERIVEKNEYDLQIYRYAVDRLLRTVR